MASIPKNMGWWFSDWNSQLFATSKGISASGGPLMMLG
jgi:hypothetical protein